MSDNYIRDLKSQKKAKEKQLQELYKKRDSHSHNKENWYNTQQAINIKSVDIQTLQSRIDNYGRKVNLPDHTNVETIINQIK